MSEFNSPHLKVMISASDLASRVTQLGHAISKDFADIVQQEELVLIGILKGSCVFMADLMRQIDLPLTIDFMAVSSYKDGTESSGDVEILKDLTYPIRGKHIIICEDIVDSGLTLNRLSELLMARGPKSLKIASCLSKPSRRKQHVNIDYCGFEVEDKFVVGYGLDAASRYRNLPYIGVLQTD